MLNQDDRSRYEQMKDYETFLRLREMAERQVLTVHGKIIRPDDIESSVHWPGINITLYGPGINITLYADQEMLVPDLADQGLDDEGCVEVEEDLAERQRTGNM